jgi:glycosyltransferase involved in cell wall biosynthesis
MTILHTSFHKYMVGETNRILLLCRQLKSWGHQVIIATPAKSELARKALEAGLEVYREVSFVKGVHPYSTVQDVFRLKKIIEDRQIQILHTHGSKDSWAGAWGAYLTSSPPKVVRTRHNIFPVSRHFLNRLLYRRLTDHLVVISRFILDSYIQDGFIDPQNISLIHSSVDLAKFDPIQNPGGKFREEFGIDPTEKVVGMVANVVPYKGPHDFLEAAFRVIEQKNGVRFLLVGEGDDALLETLKEQVKKKGLSQKIIFTGIRNDIPAVLADIDVFCLPTHKEGLGTAILEAMAMQKPVVATRVGGIPDSVLEGETGYLVDPGDSDNLSRKILALMGDPEKAEQMGKKGRLRVEDKFTLQVMAKKTEKLYKQLLGKNN